VQAISRSVAQTQRIAAELARTLKGGECVALHGNLGAGKTQFVRGLVSALGANPRAVSSPTFVLLNVYPGGRLAVYHLDAYRVSGAQDFEAIGFGELLEQGGVVVVEWASKVAELLPAGTIHVHIEPLARTTRAVRIEIAP
jgi:tRNA threonylcarbamoyladenosine biosynthesis protein TsaE